MKKAPKTPKVDPYLEGLVGKLVDRLVALEKKVDSVLSHVSNRPAPAAASNPAPAAAPRRDRTLYEAICAECSKVCEVPFKPVEGRPVYCKTCWAGRKSGGAKTPNGMPVLTPVALPSKPKPAPAVLPASAPSAKKTKKSPSKKPKKKK